VIFLKKDIEQKKLEKREYNKLYYIRNYKQILIQTKEYIKKNKNKIAKYQKEYRLNNKNNRKKYVLNNKDKINIQTRNTRQKRKLVNLKYRLKIKLYGRYRSLLKYQLDNYDENKKDYYNSYLGCKLSFFINYIESQFNDNMSWHNYASYWEFDHIIPIDNFNLFKTKQIKECFNYNNVQPLIKELNRAQASEIINNRRRV